ncbi:hypothetical protein C7974DRAFT_441563, partial [Boeremia exigua]|uniref:uncharacterized protein n=1 Tax=Boeremia exigua TaxID=749465 RepID=UPI001E8D050F
DNPPTGPDVTFDFNLPHGIDIENDTVEIEQLQDSSGIADHSSQVMYGPRDEYEDEDEDEDVHMEVDFDDHGKHDLNYRYFSPGFSNDEGSDEAFEHYWLSHQAKKQARKGTKGKKSPRRSENGGDDFGSAIRVKRPRQSLFGGAEEELDDEEQADDLLKVAAAAADHGIGNRMSSLNLDQQQQGDENMPSATNTGFGLACSDVGSVRNSPIPSDDEPFIPPDTTPYYQLRQGIDRKKAVTHVDNDKSGNWDPEQGNSERAARPGRTKAAKKRREKEKRGKKGRIDAPSSYTMKCIVRLPIDAIGEVRNSTNDEQNWPDNWSEIDSEQERELKEYREAYRSNTPNPPVQLSLEDPAGILDDITGHPAARGCKQCRKLDRACSMIEGGMYPREQCIKDGSECQPIQEPTIKGRCKQCDHADEEVCSFEDDPTQPICNYCADNDHVCEALPPHGYKAPRMSVSEVVWGPDRPFVACTTCRSMKKRCSLKTKKDTPPCKWCRNTGNPCRFVDPPDPRSEKQKKRMPSDSIAPKGKTPQSMFFTEEDIANMGRRNTVILEREPTPELEMEDAEGNKGMLVKIATSFAHPIRFGVEKITCSFCEDPTFAVFGHFERQVHVIRWHSGMGYAEVGGGHCQNTGETAMCNDCMNKRLQIMVCPGHQLERITGATSSDQEALADELCAAESGGPDGQYQLSRWCSLCFSPAIFGCSTVQPDLCGEEEMEIAGCHLRLCLVCEVALRTQHGGNLDAMATELDHQPKISELDETTGMGLQGRPRADVGLLMQDGLLMRAAQVE